MLKLLKTFIDIIALRRGPEAIPASGLVMLVALVMMLVSSHAATTLIPVTQEPDYLLTWLAYGLGIAFYGAIVFLTGHSARLLPTLSAIIGCGSLITLLFVAEWLLFEPLFGRQFAVLVAQLIIFWAVPVEGHIMARAIDQHWLVGIVIAVLAFTLQYGVQTMAAAPAQG